MNKINLKVIAAGSVMGEFQGTNLIPEIDAYRYRDIAKLAADSGKAVKACAKELSGALVVGIRDAVAE